MTLLLGANLARYAELETALGVPMDICRSYASGVSDALSKITADKAAGRVSWVSISSWPTTADITRLMDTITSPVMLTYLHEEDLGPKVAIATFKSRTATLWDASQSNPNVQVGPILTHTPYLNQTHAQYYQTGKFDFVGVDAYRFWRQDGSLPDPKVGGVGQNRSIGYLLGEENANGTPKAGGGAATFAAANGVPIAIGEFGAHPFTTDHSNRPIWLAQTIAWLRAHNASAACYFHYQIGESGPWLLDRFHVYTTDPNDPARLTGASDPDSLAAFRNEFQGAAAPGTANLDLSGDGALTFTGVASSASGTLSLGGDGTLTFSGSGTGTPPPPPPPPPPTGEEDLTAARGSDYGWLHWRRRWRRYP